MEAESAQAYLRRLWVSKFAQNTTQDQLGWFAVYSNGKVTHHIEPLWSGDSS